MASLKTTVIILSAMYALCLPDNTDATPGHALTAEIKTGVCNLNSDLAKYPAYTATNLRKATKAEERMTAAELKLQIFIQQHETEKAVKRIPLLAANSEKHASQLQSIREATTQALEAAAKVAALNGRLVETMELLADIHQHSGSASNAGCLTKQAGQVYSGRSTLTGCGGEIQSARPDEETELTQLTQKGFEKLPTAVRNTKVGQETAACRLLQTENSNGPLEDQRTSNDATLAAGYINLGDNSATITVKDLQDLRGCKLAGAPKPFQAAYTAFKAAEQQLMKLTASYTELSLGDVKASTAAKTLYKRLVKKTTEPYDAQKDEPVLTNEMEAAYGTSTNFKTDWVDKYSQNKVDKISYDSNATGNESLTDIKDVDKLQKTLAYYAGVQAAVVATKLQEAQAQIDKLKQRNVAAKKTPETEATCEAKGTGDNCKDGCKLTGEGTSKKCVVDPNYKPPKAEGGEKDSKTGTTNTTGSNSFVITKDPLLLAVLLL
uniref:Variant surface glycoprotein 525 n=1 Tax=Trypanosoma brucei TaxID=5691 RepID=M4SYA4_9TRYP|nr:variant surface glycoprotein 525 [Trypanosoma brucei]